MARTPVVIQKAQLTQIKQSMAYPPPNKFFYSANKIFSKEKEFTR